MSDFPYSITNPKDASVQGKVRLTIGNYTSPLPFDEIDTDAAIVMSSGRLYVPARDQDMWCFTDGENCYGAFDEVQKIQTLDDDHDSIAAVVRRFGENKSRVIRLGATDLSDALFESLPHSAIDHMEQTPTGALLYVSESGRNTRAQRLFVDDQGGPPVHQIQKHSIQFLQDGTPAYAVYSKAGNTAIVIGDKVGDYHSSVANFTVGDDGIVRYEVTNGTTKMWFEGHECVSYQPQKYHETQFGDRVAFVEQDLKGGQLQRWRVLFGTETNWEQGPWIDANEYRPIHVLGQKDSRPPWIIQADPADPTKPLFKPLPSS